MLNRLVVDNECDGLTDGQTEWPLAVACSNLCTVVRRALKILYIYEYLLGGTILPGFLFQKRYVSDAAC